MGATRRVQSLTFVSLIPDYISIIPQLLIVFYAKTGPNLLWILVEICSIFFSE